MEKTKKKYITILKLLLIIVVVSWIYNIEIKQKKHKIIVIMSYLNLVIWAQWGKAVKTGGKYNFQVAF